MENILKTIYEFITSSRFTATCTSILAILIAIWPIISKVLNAKQKLKLETLKTNLTNKSEELKQFLASSEELKKLIVQLEKQNQIVVENAINQAEAIRIAFNSSNLKTDVKLEIEKILQKSTTIEKPPLREDEKLNDKELLSSNSQKLVLDEKTTIESNRILIE